MFNIVVYIASILGMTANAQFIRMECPGFQNTTFVVPFFKQGSTNRPACAYQNHKYTFYTSNSNDTVNYPVVSRMSCLSCPTSWTPSALLNSTCEPDTDSTLFGCPSGNFLSEAASVNDTILVSQENSVTVLQTQASSCRAGYYTAYQRLIYRPNPDECLLILSSNGTTVYSQDGQFFQDSVCSIQLYVSDSLKNSCDNSTFIWTRLLVDSTDLVISPDFSAANAHDSILTICLIVAGGLIVACISGCLITQLYRLLRPYRNRHESIKDEESAKSEHDVDSGTTLDCYNPQVDAERTPSPRSDVAMVFVDGADYPETIRRESSIITTEPVAQVQQNDVDDARILT